MKNSEIHKGLPQEEIRDFLSLAMIKAYEEEMNNKKKIVPYPGDSTLTFTWAIKDAEAEIMRLQKYIEIAKTKEAIIRLIMINGWEEFDVSDKTRKDSNYRLQMNFIGTEKEYKELLKKIKEE